MGSRRGGRARCSEEFLEGYMTAEALHTLFVEKRFAKQGQK